VDVCMCVCVCVYACMYVCMYVCVYLCMHVCIYVCVYYTFENVWQVKLPREIQVLEEEIKKYKNK